MLDVDLLKVLDYYISMISYDLLRRKMVENRISGLGLSKEVGIGMSTVTSLKNDKVVSMTIIEKLCEYFHCQPCDLMEYKDTEDNNVEL